MPFPTKYLIFFVVLLLQSTIANSQNISTMAGSGPDGFMTGSYGGDGGSATTAFLNMQSGLAIDTMGNLYVADTWNGRIRKIDTAGIITTFAGTGTIGYGGDGGPATAADMSFPESIVFDAIGNMYVADRSAPSIRKIDPAGIITTVAGNGTFGYSGDGGPATAALLDNPYGVQVDAIGNLYICDWVNSRLRKVDAAGIITTIAGNGSSTYSGDGGPATAAGISPIGVLIDPVGNILICDASNSGIRKIDITGTITTIAGTGTSGYSGDGGPATAAQFRSPGYIRYDNSGNLIVCDKANHVLRKIDAAGIVTTFAGTGVSGFSGDGSPAISATFRFPACVVFNSMGQLLVSDLQNNRIRKIDIPGVPVPTKIIKIFPGNEVNVYPNPTSNTLCIEGITPNACYELTDITGCSIMHGNFTKKDNTLSLATIAPGLYFLQLITGNNVRTVKVVKK